MKNRTRNEYEAHATLVATQWHKQKRAQKPRERPSTSLLEAILCSFLVLVIILVAYGLLP